MLSAALLCGFVSALPKQSADTVDYDEDTLLSLDVLQEMFPTGRYWNHMGMESNNPRGTTDIPCNHSKNSERYCNRSYQYDTQCYGYAQQLALMMYGSRFRTWTCDKNMDNLKAGDVIVFGYVGQFGGHTIMVTDVEDDILYYTDCNTGGQCRIDWTGWHAKSYFADEFIETPGKVSINGVYHAPYEAPKHFIETGHIMTEEEAAGQTLPDGDYQIVSSVIRNFFMNHADITAEEQYANVQMNQYPYEKAPGENDIWELTYQNNGFYTIREKDSGQYLSVSNDSTESRTNVVLCAQNDSDTQLWSVSPTADGYEIRSKCGAWYLNVESCMAEDGRNVQVWINSGNIQSWGFIPETDPDTKQIPEGRYYIRSLSDPDYYMHITELDAQQVIIWKCAAVLSDTQKDAFTLTHFQSDANRYGIALPFREWLLYMDLNTEFSSLDHLREGCSIKVDTAEPDAVRQSLYWDFRPAGDGSYYIVSKAGGYCLTADPDAVAETDPEAENDPDAEYDPYHVISNLSQQHFTGADNQKWILERLRMPGELIAGDVNADGVCDRQDAEVLQSWLLAKPNTVLGDWKAGDLNGDFRLTASDLSMLLRMKIS